MNDITIALVIFQYGIAVDLLFYVDVYIFIVALYKFLIDWFEIIVSLS